MHHWSAGVFGLTTQAPLMSHIMSSPQGVPQNWPSQGSVGPQPRSSMLAAVQAPVALHAISTAGEAQSDWSGGQGAQPRPQGAPTQGS